MGRLVAEQLARQAGTLRWGLAGRSEAKLRSVRDELAQRHAACANLPLLIADAADESALTAVAARARVICTTVGPYARHGLPLAPACAQQGTDYCDLTGGVHFMRQNIDRNHDTARRTGARILHTCGFDSIPSDIGVLCASDALRQKGQPLREAHLYLRSAKGAFSGGTLASMLGVLEAAQDRNTRRMMANPLALVPTADPALPQQHDPRSVTFDREAGQWTVPFFMGVVSSRVVHRSNALLGYPYGPAFRYAEDVGLGRGPRAALMGGAIVGGLAGVLLLSGNAKARPLLSRLVPQPGQGPSPEQMQKDRWSLSIRGYVEG